MSQERQYLVEVTLQNCRNHEKAFIVLGYQFKLLIEAHLALSSCDNIFQVVCYKQIL